MNNDVLDIEIQDLINSSQLFYEENTEICNSVSKATNNPVSEEGTTCTK